jgi:dTDP-4-amino-4,6-dideoxygalactose transaminase
MEIPIMRLGLGDAEVEAASRIIRSGWIAQGEEVAAFEREFAAAVGAKHAVATSNCTTALQLALRVAGVKPGDDVATVSHSFIATANAVVSVGARPLFIDIQAATFNMDPEALSAALSPATKAILVVHQIGHPAEMPAILAIAKARGIPVIEDAACALGSEIQMGQEWQRIGRPHGLLACFSFHPRKLITTGDGGMITTADPALADRLRLLRQHAMVMSTSKDPKHVPADTYKEVGFNFRMTDLQAAVGRPQLARLADIIKERRALAARYHEALTQHPWLEPPSEQPWARSNWQSYAVTLRPACKKNQTEIMRFLQDNGISARRGINNAHTQPAYRQTPWTCGPKPCDTADHDLGWCRNLEISQNTRDRTILLPLFQGMKPEEQAHVLACLQKLPGT